MESVTSTEFLDWIWYLDWKDTKEFNRSDHYLAQIAAQIERGQVKHPEKVTVQSKILKFTKDGDKQVEAKNGVQNSKNYWMALAGIKGKKNGVRPKSRNA